MNEELKQPLLISVLVANGVIVASQLIFKLKYPDALLGILLGVAIGGAVFAAMYLRNRD